MGFVVAIVVVVVVVVVCIVIVTFTVSSIFYGLENCLQLK